jgi:hypothetical protein
MADYQVRRWDAWHNHMALVMLGTLFLVKQKKRAANSGPCCHSTIWSQPLSICFPADNSRLKNWRTLSASVTIYAERPRNHTPDGLKWPLNESDKVELGLISFIPADYIQSLHSRLKGGHLRHQPLELIS